MSTAPADWSLDDMMQEVDELAAAHQQPERDLVEQALEADETALPFILDQMNKEQKLAYSSRLDAAVAPMMEQHEEEKRSAAIKKLAADGGPVLLTPPELRAMQILPRDPLFTLVDDMTTTVFAERDYGMLFAKRGVGKTMLGLSLGLALAGGGRLMHLRAVAPRRVVYVDGEMPVADLRSRVESLLLALPKAERSVAEQNFRLCSWETHEDGIPSLAGPGGQAFVDAAIRASDPAVVILDNISSLAGTAAESSDEEWGPVGAWAKAYRKERSIIWIHHASRQGTARGTSKREDPLDWVISLRQPRGYEAEDGSCFELVWEKARGRNGKAVETRTFRLDENKTDLGTILQWNEISAEDATSKALSQKRSRLDPIARAILKAHPSITKRSFRAQVREMYKEQYGDGIGQAAIDTAYDFYSSGGLED